MDLIEQLELDNEKYSCGCSSKEEENEPDLLDLSEDQNIWWKSLNEIAYKYLRENNELYNKFQPSIKWTIRATSQILSTPNNVKKDKVLTFLTTSENGIAFMLKALECFIDCPIKTVRISAILRECVNPKNQKHRLAVLKQMNELDYIPLTIKILNDIHFSIKNSLDTSFKEGMAETNINLIWFLSAVGTKDPRFTNKVRRNARVRFMHHLIKRNFFLGSSSPHYPLLKMLRMLSKHPKVARTLGKDRVMQTIAKILVFLNNQSSPKFRILLEILIYLTKEKINCRRFVKVGLLNSMVRAFSFWGNWKGKALVKFSKFTIKIFTNLANSNYGKMALIEGDALITLKKFCEVCPTDRGFDDIVIKSVSLLSLCYSTYKLPFEPMNPIKFDIPIVPGATAKIGKETGTSSDDDDAEDQDAASEDQNSEPDSDAEIDLSDEDNDNCDQDRESNAEDEDDEEADEDDEGEEDEENIKINESNKNDKKIKTKKGDDKDEKKYFPLLSKTADMNLNVIDDKSECDLSILESEDAFNKTSSENRRESWLSNVSKFFKEMNLDQNSSKINNNERKNSLNIFTSKESIINSTEQIDFSQIFCPTIESISPWVQEHPEYSGLKDVNELRNMYIKISNKVRGVSQFVKIAYPDLVLGYSYKKVEYLNPSTDRGYIRDKIISYMDRIMGSERFNPKLIYDLDNLILYGCPKKKLTTLKHPRKNSLNFSRSILGNDDEIELGNCNRKEPLAFESRFESGNLRRVEQVGEREYDLYLTSDINTAKHNQWFYFQVSNMMEEFEYTFNIVNCIKGNSQFNFGMQPVVFSVREAVEGRPGWVRSGSNICYYRNGLKNMCGRKRKNGTAYKTASFNICFKHRGDICYIAYHFPFTYSRLLTELWKLKSIANDSKIYMRYDILCETINKNEVPLISITAPEDTSLPIKDRDVIFLSSRVHPGESNSSWVMHGILHRLVLGKGIGNILKKHVFKIVPMLNIEGVINGCHRCGLTAEDLNRKWKSPNPLLHPTIFNAKSIIQYSCKVLNKIPVIVLDLHGHSRRKNVFFYGCSLARSWSTEDRLIPENPNIVRSFSEAMAVKSPSFALGLCNYDVRKNRESTARVALWREFGIARSYTLESSYCGCDRGPYKGMSLGICQLVEIGENLCLAIEEMLTASSSKSSFSGIYEEEGTGSKVDIFLGGGSGDENEIRYKDKELSQTIMRIIEEKDKSSLLLWDIFREEFSSSELSSNSSAEEEEMWEEAEKKFTKTSDL